MNNYSDIYDINTIKLVTKYWLFKQLGGGKSNKKKWTTLEHNGVIFSPPYIPHKIPIIYQEQKIVLNELAEEYATLFAKFTESEYINNKIFRKNFWNDWKKTLRGMAITSLDLCDFSLIYKHILELKQQKSLMSKEEKEKEKLIREKLEEKYKIALVDGKEQPVGNYKMEPPGIFLGRGCHPKLGSIKARIMPEDVTINIGYNAAVPTPPDGHKWKEIVHDQEAVWLASWEDTISGKLKYVWLGNKSNWKAESDRNKFDLARKLKKNIKHIREENDINMLNPEEKIKQIATALYFIENLALRVGNEKGEDEADTVGVTSLRVEHISLLPSLFIELDFLGKDSIRYVKKVQVSEVVYNNLKTFMEGKNKEDDLFDKINSSDLNKYLQEFLTGLTAKVFRTYNASHLFQKELNKISKKYESLDDVDKINKIYDEYNKANAKVALLCNHQKKVSNSFSDQLKKINDSIKKNKKSIKNLRDKGGKGSDEKIKKLKKKIDELKAKKAIKVELKGVALETSKTNYIDPRISVAFIKKHGLSVDKIFQKKLQEKFFWAFDVDEKFKF